MARLMSGTIGEHMTAKGKAPADSAVEQNVYKIFPNDLNSKYTVFGGVVMSLCDRIALIVAAEDNHSGDHRHVVSAYLTFVALDGDGKPTSVPPVLPQTDAEKRRYQAAQRRRDARIASRSQANRN